LPGFSVVPCVVIFELVTVEFANVHTHFKYLILFAPSFFGTLVVGAEVVAFNLPLPGSFVGILVVDFAGGVPAKHEN
jgi:hypothetical protein